MEARSEPSFSMHHLFTPKIHDVVTAETSSCPQTSARLFHSKYCLHVPACYGMIFKYINLISFLLQILDKNNIRPHSPSEIPALWLMVHAPMLLIFKQTFWYYSRCSWVYNMLSPLALKDQDQSINNYTAEKPLFKHFTKDHNRSN